MMSPAKEKIVKAGAIALGAAAGAFVACKAFRFLQNAKPLDEQRMVERSEMPANVFRLPKKRIAKPNVNLVDMAHVSEGMYGTKSA